MSANQKKWFKSAFSQELLFDEPPEKKTKYSSLSQGCNTENEDLDELSKDIGSRIIPGSNTNTDATGWMENFCPNSISELAIHPKKISEVKDWLLRCEVMRNKKAAQMLLITGPAGSGKTATVKAVAKELKYELTEWITPLDVEIINENGETTFKESQVEIFKKFLFRSSRYKSLFDSLEKRVILVEDFPNVFINDPNSFSDVLESYQYYGKSPIIFIATDSKNKQLNIAFNLFSDQVCQRFGIAQINFNPVSNTLIKKALKTACSIMSKEGFSKYYKMPSQDVIDSINLSAQGDIRNAIINLHFASQKGSSQVKLEYQPQSKMKKSWGRTKQLAGIGRDESLTLMHGLGRVFNTKFTEESGRRRLVHSPEAITESFSSEPRSFTDFIHANYLSHFSSIEMVASAINSLSCSDMLLKEYRESEVIRLGLNIAIRGVMIANEKPLSGWMPVKGPKRLTKEENMELEMEKLGIKGHMSRNIFASDVRTFARIIFCNVK